MLLSLNYRTGIQNTQCLSKMFRKRAKKLDKEGTSNG